MKHDSQHISNLTRTQSCLKKWQHQYKQIDRAVAKIKHLFKLEERLEIINLISCQFIKALVYSCWGRWGGKMSALLWNLKPMKITLHWLYQIANNNTYIFVVCAA